MTESYCHLIVFGWPLYSEVRPLNQFQWTNIWTRKVIMIVSNLTWLHDNTWLTWLHDNSVRIWHYSLCQEEIKLWYLHKIFFCVVLSPQHICLKDFSRYSSSKHRQGIKNSWRHLLRTELSWINIFKHKLTRQWFPCSRDSCFLLVFPVTPNWQITWQYQIRLSKINLFNHYLPKESYFSNILKRVTVELMDFQHLEPPNRGTVWYLLYLKLFPLLACMLDSW